MGEWDLQENLGRAGQTLWDLLSSWENWAVLWIQAFGVGGWDLQEIPIKSGQTLWGVLSCQENWVLPHFQVPCISSREIGFQGDFLEKQAEPLGCVVQPGKLGCPVDSGIWCKGKWDFQQIPRGAGQILRDVFCQGACFSRNFTTQKRRKWKNHIIPSDESLPPSCPVPLLKEYQRGRGCLGNTKLSLFPGAFPRSSGSTR